MSYLACQARAAGIDFTKDGNCFAAVAAPTRPGSGRRHLVAASDYRAPEPGLQPVDLHPRACASVWTRTRWRGGGFGYAHSVYWVEYSRNLLVAAGALWD